MEKILVTFDIDGTLIQSAEGGIDLNAAINKAAFDVFGIDQDMEEYIESSFSGTTDYWIANEIAKRAKPDCNNREELIQKFLKLETKYYHELFENDVIPLPGASKILEFLSQRPDVVIALSTGNLEAIAWKKMQTCNLEHYFKGRYGGFGEICERKDILRAAYESAQKGEQLGERSNCTEKVDVSKCQKFLRHIHIGDAHQDVEAAKKVGAIPIAVETGNLRFDDFVGPCFVVNNLEDGFDDVVSIICTGKPKNENIFKP
ncbi:haloacid dehalogenase-like hydrolase family protein [Tritrichomonas foetus]|uniref:Haloacid dehalogenase-like hydrolase family protein n=1 Tax=Tritrichomonas foetus TaxID=1144522 RepID=A0A1J4J3E7_9EUKA|nr:haloacid dehalogenase-like hydrolase family protein [Tritrichomonas foetus]|eukprot:OHS92679.1 haloacid dehalogenase-like hydrolase family protein [Tritrichomonas foetus]